MDATGQQRSVLDWTVDHVKCTDKTRPLRH